MCVWPLSIAPGLVSKELLAHLTMFELEPLARKVILCCTLLALIDLALKKGPYNYMSLYSARFCHTMNGYCKLQPLWFLWGIILLFLKAKTVVGDSRVCEGECTEGRNCLPQSIFYREFCKRQWWLKVYKLMYLCLLPMNHRDVEAYRASTIPCNNSLAIVVA